MYTLFNNDCLAQLDEFPTHSIDLVLTDPPYGCTDNEWDSVIDFSLLVQKLKRVVKPNGWIILTAQGSFVADVINAMRSNFSHIIIWHKNFKRGFLNAKRLPLRAHEFIICFRMGKGATYNPQMTAGKPYKASNKNKGSTNYRFIPTKKGEDNDGTRYPIDVLKFDNSLLDDKSHPTQKPIEMGRYLVRQYSNFGDTVLDFTAGTGAFVIATILEGRNAIGIELNNEYYEHALLRIADIAKSQEPRAKSQEPRAKSHRFSLFATPPRAICLSFAKTYSNKHFDPFQKVF